MSTHKDKLEVVELWLKITAILIGSVWAGYTFYYEKIYLDSKNPSFLNITSKIAQVGAVKGNNIYDIEVTFQNKSKKKEKLIASWFHIGVSNFDFEVNSSDSSFVLSNKLQLDSADRFGRYFAINNLKTIDTGRLFDTIWLNTDQEITTHFLTSLPKNKFNYLTVHFYGLTSENEEIAKSDWTVSDNGQVIPNIRLFDKNGKLIKADLLGETGESKYFENIGVVFTHVFSEKFAHEN